jgi:hypothetical protein
MIYEPMDRGLDYTCYHRLSPLSFQSLYYFVDRLLTTFGFITVVAANLRQPYQQLAMRENVIHYHYAKIFAVIAIAPKRHYPYAPAPQTRQDDNYH